MKKKTIPLIIIGILIIILVGFLVYVAYTRYCKPDKKCDCQNTNNKNVTVSTKKKKENYSEEFDKVAKVEENVFYKDHSIKATLKELKYDDENSKVYLHTVIENKSDIDIINVNINNVYINDIETFARGNTQIAKNKKEDFYVGINYTLLKKLKIFEIGIIEFDFSIDEFTHLGDNTNEFKELYVKNNIIIKTDLTDYYQAKEISSKLIVDQNDIEIYYLGFEETENEIYPEIYIVNNTDKMITFSPKGVIINEESKVNNNSAISIKSHKSGYLPIYVGYDELEKNSIEVVNTIEFAIECFDKDESLFTTDTIVIDIN